VASVPDGRERLAYSRLIAVAGASMMPLPWQCQRLSANHVLQAFLWNGTSQVQNSLLTEFGPDLRKVGRRVIARLRSRDNSVAVNATSSSLP